MHECSYFPMFILLFNMLYNMLFLQCLVLLVGTIPVKIALTWVSLCLNSEL